MEVKKVFQNKNAIARFQELYLCESTADVYFVFMKDQQDYMFYKGAYLQQRIPAHKIILAANSSIFHGMFFGTMKETGDIKIVDATPHAFLLFLNFFYFKQMTISLEYVGELFYLAHKYDVADCSAECVEFLKEVMQIENVCYIYELAILFDLKDMAQVCEKLICHETAAVFGSEHFRNCTQSTLQRLLKMDCFNCNEATVFEACMDWAEEECKRNGMPTTTANRKLQLSTCFNLIRFPSMDWSTLTACLNGYPDLFPADELENIIHQSTTKFNPICRRIWNVWHCSRHSTNFRRYITLFDAVVFTANRTLLLEEVSTQVITSHRSLNELSGSICVMRDCRLEKTASDEVQLLQSIHFKNGMRNRIVFDAPIVIEAGKRYEIKIHLNKNWSYEGFSVPKRLLDRVVSNEGIEVKFENSFRFSKECLISDLVFKLNP